MSSLTTDLARQQHEFRAGLKQELEGFLAQSKFKRPGSGKQTQKTYEAFKGFEASMSQRIDERVNLYVRQLGIEALPTDTRKRRVRASNGQLQAHLDDLESQLGSLTAEADALRTQCAERGREEVDAALTQYSDDVLRSRAAGLSLDRAQGHMASTAAAEQYPQQLRQIENLIANTEALTASIDQERENNERLERARAHGAHYMEAELLKPVGSSASSLRDSDENCRMQSELERNQEIIKRMQQFEA
jgi:hypothetical protein